MTVDNESTYKPYLINHFLSGTIDTVLYAAEMNVCPFLDSRMQYDYLRHSIRSKKRYSKWLKKEKSDSVDLIKEYYKCNTQRAEEIVRILTEEEIEDIRLKLDRGGVS